MPFAYYHLFIDTPLLRCCQSLQKSWKKELLHPNLCAITLSVTLVTSSSLIFDIRTYSVSNTLLLLVRGLCKTLHVRPANSSVESHSVGIFFSLFFFADKEHHKVNWQRVPFLKLGARTMLFLPFVLLISSFFLTMVTDYNSTMVACLVKGLIELWLL